MGQGVGKGLTCQTSLVASLVYRYHLAKKALGKGLQLLQKTPVKHTHITFSGDRTLAATALQSPGEQSSQDVKPQSAWSSTSGATDFNWGYRERAGNTQQSLPVPSMTEANWKPGRLTYFLL